MRPCLKNTLYYQPDFLVYVACVQCIKHITCLRIETYGEPPLYNGEYDG